MSKRLANIKSRINFEKKAAICVDCKHFQKSTFGDANTVRFQPPFCNLHKFVAHQTSICDTWESINGEIFNLEKL
jgi:hypothetical protein